MPSLTLFLGRLFHPQAQAPGSLLLTHWLICPPLQIIDGGTKYRFSDENIEYPFGLGKFMLHFHTL